MSQSINRAYVTGPAPSFKAQSLLPSGEFGEVSFPPKGKYSVLFFYPLDFTFVCPTEIIEFSDRIEEFQRLNADVFACSVDSHFAHLAWSESPRTQGGLGRLNIPIISDLTKQIAKDYGVLLEKEGFALRGTFIVDDKGVLRHATLNDPPVGRSIDETLRLVAAYQYTDKYGEVCPSSWIPGSKTIKPTPKQKGEYFSSSPTPPTDNGHTHVHT